MAESSEFRAKEKEKLMGIIIKIMTRRIEKGVDNIHMDPQGEWYITSDTESRCTGIDSSIEWMGEREREAKEWGWRKSQRRWIDFPFCLMGLYYYFPNPFSFWIPHFLRVRQRRRRSTVEGTGQKEEWKRKSESENEWGLAVIVRRRCWDPSYQTPPLEP